MSFRTPLSRVTGLGSAKSGTEHFWNQRMTALANVPLMLFSVWLVITLVGADRAQMVATFANPFITGFAILTILSAAIHMRLGLQVVIEDYVHTESTKWLLLMLNSFFAFGVAIIATVSLLKLSFGG
ncbi:succinate dehydrogenase / fumarate reductase membrane anchor subunit [Maritalea mobilis]|uniref:Succinate dehydrogenase hydrophobic membrane anchor subunit n=1 Tax=Maritalea mobilis TaxID=483324 RepID=A0A4R6VJ92_9HYPH|nr:succinate dehydrogenase, hydrophobic membrane anchor protein [Maritalea mobilis]TDQ61648.1 succinate dehydrogenase / fumarate reductase membrane anchor subunit [Maritalea mobilis]